VVLAGSSGVPEEEASSCFISGLARHAGHYTTMVMWYYTAASLVQGETSLIDFVRMLLKVFVRPTDRA
jgi:hypothetical protein